MSKPCHTESELELKTVDKRMESELIKKQLNLAKDKGNTDGKGVNNDSKKKDGEIKKQNDIQVTCDI